MSSKPEIAGSNPAFRNHDTGTANVVPVVRTRSTGAVQQGRQGDVGIRRRGVLLMWTTSVG